MSTDQFIITPYFINEDYAALRELPVERPMLVAPEIDGLNEVAAIQTVHPHLKAAVAYSIEEGNRPISIAGDCCATIPVLGGLQAHGLNPVLLWLDAHGDFNTHDTTPSNFLGGMPLAMLAGIGDLSFCENIGVKPMNQADIILCDGRDLDPGERELVENSNIQHAKSLSEVDFNALRNRQVWVHFDTDIINLAEMRAVAYPAHGGPRSNELKQFFAQLRAEVNIVAISMTTWDPELDPSGAAQNLCMTLLQHLI